VRFLFADRKDVLPLGSKQSLSNGKEPEELTDLIAAFEAQNKCRITLSACLKLRKGYQDMEWTAECVNREQGLTAHLPLGFVSVSVWAGDFKTLMGLVTRLLYALDFQLALNEFDSAKAKKA